MITALEASRTRIPKIIINGLVERAWVGGLIGGDGSISANYHPEKAVYVAVGNGSYDR